jgi:hypothetical protein
MSANQAIAYTLADPELIPASSDALRRSLSLGAPRLWPRSALGSTHVQHACEQRCPYCLRCPCWLRCSASESLFWRSAPLPGSVRGRLLARIVAGRVVLCKEPCPEILQRIQRRFPHTCPCIRRKISSTGARQPKIETGRLCYNKQQQRRTNHVCVRGWSDEQTCHQFRIC